MGSSRQICEVQVGQIESHAPPHRVLSLKQLVTRTVQVQSDAHEKHLHRPGGKGRGLNFKQIRK